MLISRPPILASVSSGISFSCWKKAWWHLSSSSMLAFTWFRKLPWKLVFFDKKSEKISCTLNRTLNYMSIFLFACKGIKAILMNLHISSRNSSSARFSSLITYMRIWNIKFLKITNLAACLFYLYTKNLIGLTLSVEFVLFQGIVGVSWF